VNNKLEATGLKAYYLVKTVKGKTAAMVHAVDDVSLQVHEGEILGIAGESGCGKSTLAKALYGWIKPPLQVVDGSITYQVQNEIIDILNANENRLKQIWWNVISYIPQSSMNVLNPTMRIKDQFFNVMKTHMDNFDRKEAEAKISKHIDECGLPREVTSSFPHQLSGGMKQRVVITLATILNCDVVIADEPTTALDVIVQRGILQLLKQTREKLKCTIIVITHDMGVHAQIADRVAIMYAGNIVEVGPVDEIFNDPQNPYTKFLISSLPRIGDKERKDSISGKPPSLMKPPKGCRFYPRCPFAMDICREKQPILKEVRLDHWASCHLLK
jgi:peptide/nickel transport system ATP-binding protein